jgi:hypothetical protein
MNWSKVDASLTRCLLFRDAPGEIPFAPFEVFLRCILGRLGRLVFEQTSVEFFSGMRVGLCERG